jgi:hypothetical protein
MGTMRLRQHDSSLMSNSAHNKNCRYCQQTDTYQDFLKKLTRKFVDLADNYIRFPKDIPERGHTSLPVET